MQERQLGVVVRNSLPYLAHPGPVNFCLPPLMISSLHYTVRKTLLTSVCRFSSTAQVRRYLFTISD